MAYAYELWADSDKLRTAISMEDGAAQALVHFLGTGTVGAPTPPGLTDLTDFTSYLTGSVGNTAPDPAQAGTSYNAGRIQRNLPLVHPFMPQISVAGVTSIVGASEGGKSTVASLNVIGLPPLSSTIDLYPSYLYAVELRKRKYFLLPDVSIPTGSGTYYPPDGSSGVAYNYAQEWRRFTEQALIPQPDTASATVGTQVFRTHTGAAPAGATFANTSFVYLQNQRLTYTWYQVPYRYFFPYTVGSTTYKPYLTRFVNCVNQYDWNGFAAGTLMFLGATPTPYIPQIPAIVNFAGINLGLAQDLLCNVQMNFLYTARQVTDPPSGADTMLTNKNFIPAGHNAFPSFSDRKFYYCPTLGPAPSTDQTKWAAPFASFPFELLWTDPLAQSTI